VQPDPRDRPDALLPASVADAVDVARGALGDLAAVGEAIDDEWQYVQDLLEAWDERIADVGDRRGDEALSATRAAAVVALAGEAGRITDPHRAIDWLSTLPQAVLVALGERP
jgi:hypothetical protein